MMRVGQLVREHISGYVKQGIEKRKSIFLVSYSGISSLQMNDLRKTLRKAGADLYVAKNTIAERALKDLKCPKLAEAVNGQTAFIWSDADAVSVSKVLIKFAKDYEGVLVKGGLVDGKLLEKNDVKRLSDLPSREVLLANLLGTLQSPLLQFMSALNSKAGELISILKQLSEKKNEK